jgi:hypothetical protein
MRKHSVWGFEPARADKALCQRNATKNTQPPCWRIRTPACLMVPPIEVWSRHQPDSPGELPAGNFHVRNETHAVARRMQSAVRGHLASSSIRLLEATHGDFKPTGQPLHFTLRHWLRRTRTENHSCTRSIELSVSLGAARVLASVFIFKARGVPCVAPWSVQPGMLPRASLAQEACSAATRLLLNMTCAGPRGESGWCSGPDFSPRDMHTCRGSTPSESCRREESNPSCFTHTVAEATSRHQPGSLRPSCPSRVASRRRSARPFGSPRPSFRPRNPSRCFSLAGRPVREPRLGPQVQSHGSLVVWPPRNPCFLPGPCSRRTTCSAADKHRSNPRRATARSAMKGKSSQETTSRGERPASTFP